MGTDAQETGDDVRAVLTKAKIAMETALHGGVRQWGLGAEKKMRSALEAVNAELSGMDMKVVTDLVMRQEGEEMLRLVMSTQPVRLDALQELRPKHPSSVRKHLVRLANAGYIEIEKHFEPPLRPGCRYNLYSVTQKAIMFLEKRDAERQRKKEWHENRAAREAATRGERIVEQAIRKVPNSVFSLGGM
jgi:predicted transcriptional regulator